MNYDCYIKVLYANGKHDLYGAIFKDDNTVVEKMLMEDGEPIDLESTSVYHTVTDWVVSFGQPEDDKFSTAFTGFLIITPEEVFLEML